MVKRVKHLFDTSIDVNVRQFYTLALGACIGNLSGFIGNAYIYGFSAPTIFCGICFLLILLGSLIGIRAGNTKRIASLLIYLLTFVEFPVLYYIYQSGTIVYMVLAIVAIAIFLPAAQAVIIAVLALLCDMTVVVLAYRHSIQIEEVSEQSAFSTTVCSLMIVLVCVFAIMILLNWQKERQDEELKKMSEKMQFAADHDALTGLYNRRYLNHYLEHLIKKDQVHFYAALLDLDFFKKLNDTYGHLFGDEVLERFAEILKMHVGGQGIAVRFGGEEFMLVLPEWTETEVRETLDKMRREYKAFIWETKQAEFSFSSGVASYEQGMKISALYSLADEKLYQAKNGTRNQDIF